MQVPCRHYYHPANGHILVLPEDEDSMSKTLNEGCADLEQYQASKVHQLAKKLESSKATARHIKQATNNAQAAQINLL